MYHEGYQASYTIAHLVNHLKYYILQLALRKHKRIVNFGLMHLAVTNLCVWFRYLVIEVTESVHEADEHMEAEVYNTGITIINNDTV